MDNFQGCSAATGQAVTKTRTGLGLDWDWTGAGRSILANSYKLRGGSGSSEVVRPGSGWGHAKWWVWLGVALTSSVVIMQCMLIHII